MEICPNLPEPGSGPEPARNPSCCGQVRAGLGEVQAEPARSCPGSGLPEPARTCPPETPLLRGTDSALAARHCIPSFFSAGSPFRLLINYSIITQNIRHGQSSTLYTHVHPWRIISTTWWGKRCSSHATQRTWHTHRRSPIASTAPRSFERTLGRAQAPRSLRARRA